MGKLAWLGTRTGAIFLLGCAGALNAGDGEAPSDAAAAPDQATAVPADLAAEPADLTTASDASMPCNAPINSAPAVMIQKVNGAPPTPKGGPAFLDGTYHATAATLYVPADGGAGGPTGVTLQATSMLSGTSYQYTSLQSNQAAPQYTGGTYGRNGTAITFTQTCPQMAASSFVAYDSDGQKSVTLYTAPMQLGVGVITYTRQ
ncbi:MAG: hypothetical protein EXR72_10670 [Myxococcales bacterium]|nr:hypothetical protein [Myxococcales bacterium]